MSRLAEAAKALMRAGAGVRSRSTHARAFLRTGNAPVCSEAVASTALPPLRYLHTHIRAWTRCRGEC